MSSGKWRPSCLVLNVLKVCDWCRTDRVRPRLVTKTRCCYLPPKEGRSRSSCCRSGKSCKCPLQEEGSRYPPSVNFPVRKENVQRWGALRNRNESTRYLSITLNVQSNTAPFHSSRRPCWRCTNWSHFNTLYNSNKANEEYPEKVQVNSGQGVHIRHTFTSPTALAEYTRDPLH